MKICLFTEIDYKGGLDTYLINLVNSWPGDDEIVLVINSCHPGLSTIHKKLKRPTVIITTYKRFYSMVFLDKSPEVILWPRLLRFAYAILFRLLRYPVIFPLQLISLSFFFKKTSFDRLMVINGGYPASLLCRSALIAWRLAGKKRLGVLNFHSMVIRPTGKFSFFENLIDRLVISSSSKIVGVSKACIESLSVRQEFRGCVKLGFIYNGIQDPVYLSGVKESLRISSDINKNYSCLMLATYHSYKGHEYLLNAFKNVVKIFPNAHLKIYGHGSFLDKNRVIEAVKIRQLESNVLVGDFKENISPLLLEATVLVVPSQNYESFGLTIVEAMAYGVPVVATNVGGIPEVIGSSNAGYVCSKDSCQDFADAIIRLFRNPNLVSELGGNGRRHFVNHFMSEKMAKQYYQLLRNEDSFGE